MQFAHTYPQVIAGMKTQTRRIDKEGDYYDPWHECVVRNGRPLYQIGKTYAVQPGRGKKAIARIKIVGIEREYVPFITDEDAQAEGVLNRDEFLRLWERIHGDVETTAWVLKFELIKD